MRKARVPAALAAVLLAGSTLAAGVAQQGQQPAPEVTVYKTPT